MAEMMDEELVKKMIICSRYVRHYRHKNIAQDRVIELLGNNGSKMSQKEIQNRLGIRAASVSELVSKLDNRGMVVKEKSEEDRRAFNIVLTEKGKKEFEEIINSDDEYKGLFSVLSEEECVALNNILEKLGNDWLNKEPDILENQHRRGAKIVKDEHGKFDVTL
ncbi:MAG: MarR family transcriptional regulator [Eubacteriales bacterium]|nr:MarR family transcriptional regulator [Eubacteriales bacterium]